MTARRATETGERETLRATDAMLEGVDLQELMGLPAFRRFMARTAAAAGIMQTTHGSDARHSAFREGRRNLGLELLSKIDAASPGALIAIWSEPLAKPQEPKRDRRNYDPFADLRDDGSDD